MGTIVPAVLVTAPGNVFAVNVKAEVLRILAGFDAP
jgi:hypothetical protein